MVVEINSLIPLVTILGAAAAPTIAAWSAGRVANKNAKQAADAAHLAAMKAVEVKNTLVANDERMSSALTKIAATGEATHVIVNSQKTAMQEKIDAMQLVINDLVVRLDRAER
jgi:type II secretory pathway pseudopilin PulG